MKKLLCKIFGYKKEYVYYAVYNFKAKYSDGSGSIRMTLNTKLDNYEAIKDANNWINENANEGKPEFFAVIINLIRIKK